MVVSGDEEKPRRKWKETFGKGKLIVTPTNQPTDRANIVQSAFSKDGK